MKNELVSESDPLDAIVEAVLQQHRPGERPALTEYAQRHPELAERLCGIMALLLLEEPGSVQDKAAPLHAAAWSRCSKPGTGFELAFPISPAHRCSAG